MGFRGRCRGGYQPPGGFCSRRGRSHGGCAPHCVVAKSAKLRFRLRRKLRPLPCSSSPHRARRGPLLVLPKKRMRRARWKRKRRLCALRCSGPPRATGVGVSVQAPIWPGLRARYALLRGRYCRLVADGASWVGVQGRIWSAPLSARSASLRAALVVVGACTGGRMKASAPTK